MTKKRVAIAYAIDAPPRSVRLETRDDSGAWQTFDLTSEEAGQLRDGLDAALTDLRLNQVPPSITIEED